MKTKITLFLIGLISILLLNQCKVKNNNVLVDITSKPFLKLSEYNFFKGKMSDLIPNEGVLPYDLITPLFTDYAEKARFVWMPKGTSATYNKDESLDFPDGAILIKNFYYHNDYNNQKKGKRIVETRLLIKYKDKWETLPYIWNEAQTEATFEPVGGNFKIEYLDAKNSKQTINYSVPNKNQCKNCHNIKNVAMPIGPKVRNLNHEYKYTEGSKNQLEKWTEYGYLTGYVKEENINNKLAKWNDVHSGTLEERAKGYLEINCAHCHRAEGSANTSGLFLLLSEKNPESWGIMKSPVAAGKGSGDRMYDVVPGKPEESILTYRMESTDLEAMMPELGRSTVHKEGVELIKQWIANMK
jgi:uncharacterized repeat protein (TIGR03806 family)